MKKNPSVPNTTYTGSSGNRGWLVNQPGAGPSRTIPSPRTSTKDEFPTLPPPSRNNGFCNLPIPGRGRGRPRN